MGLRKQRARQRGGAEFPLNADENGNLPLDFSDWRPNPEEQYGTSELRELLTAALRELRPALRAVFVLRDVEGHSLRETAETLGVSVPAVKTRSLRARLQVRERLSAYFKNDVDPRMKPDHGLSRYVVQSPLHPLPPAAALI
jgi:RNA polymerase sigma-70 factor (ECF subfamily)